MVSDPYINARRHLHELQKAEGVPQRSVSPQEMQQYLRAIDWLELSSNKETLDKAIQLGNQLGGMDGILRHLADEALDTLPSQYSDILKHVPIGAIDTHHPYGEMRDAPGGGQFIVFHSGILTFVHDMARFIVAGTLMAPLQSREDRGLLLVTLARKAIYVCLMFAADVRLKGTHFIKLTEELNLHADHIRRLAERFCILHEYAHILQRQSSSEFAGMLDIEELQDNIIENMSKNQIAEIQADVWAAKMMACHAHPIFDKSPEAHILRLAAASLFFAMASFLEHVLVNADDIRRGINLTGPPACVDLSGYPSAHKRFRIVRQLLAEEKRSIFEAALSISDAAWNLMDILWDICKTGLSTGMYRHLSRNDE